VSEVLISFRRPPSMSKSEMRAWIIERARRQQPTLALTDADGSGSPSLLHVDLRPDPKVPLEEQLTDLMMDMRLLGLRPRIVSPDGHHAQGSGGSGSG